MFSGQGTYEKATIWILGHRNVDQRKQIKLAYQEIYLEDGNKKLKSELLESLRSILIQHIDLTFTCIQDFHIYIC